MTIDSTPYFMTNKEWYRFNEDLCRYELTDKATDKARKSYEEYYKLFEDDEDVDQN